MGLRTKSIIATGFAFIAVSCCSNAAAGVDGRRIDKCVAIEPPASESRIYRAPGAWVVYEGSLQQSLTELLPFLNMSKVEVRNEISFDVFLKNRLITDGRKPQDVADTINRELKGVKVIVIKDSFAIIKDPSENFFEERLKAPDCIKTIRFEVQKDSFEENYKRFAKYSGWKVDFSGIPVLKRKLQLKAKVIEGSSYYDVATQILSEIDMVATIEN